MPTPITEKTVFDLISRAGIDPLQAAKVQKALDAMRAGEDDKLNDIFQKDVIVPVRPAQDHRLYENGPFSLIGDEITSLVIDGGSSLMQWLPTRTMTARKHRVKHLDWIAPAGFTGSETYPEWLASIDIGECGYGPSTAWNGFEYEMGAGDFSWTTTSMKPYEDGGIRYFEDQPTYTIRGNGGVTGVIQSDAEWAMARVLWAMEQHLGYVLNFGDRNNSRMEWDGIDMINRLGYVSSKVTGPGKPTWSDPVWVNGAGVNDLGRVLQTIRVVIRLLRKRADDRNWSINGDDMIIYMDSTMWQNLIEAQASGAMYRFSKLYNFEGRISFKEFRDEISGIQTSGMIDIDGRPVRVLTDGNIGASVNLTVDDGEGGTTTVPAVIGDIHVLTRRANGWTFWYQEYLDWNNWEYPSERWDEDRFTVQGGVVRAGYVEEASKCYFYFGEMVGRLVCTMLPMQGRITNVVVPLLDAMEMEQAAFWARNFYGYGGQGAAGGEGTDLLVPTP